MTRGIVAQNPVVNTEQHKEVARDRVLSMEELAAVFAGCRDDDHGRITRLLALTGQRCREVAGMRWDELDLDQGIWTIPAARAKNKTAHKVPLSPAALALLPPRGAGDHVFGRGKAGYNNFGEAKATLDARLPATMEPWTLHDLRRSAATHMSRLGVAPHVIEQTLNHLSGHKSGVAGVYNRNTYEREVREALLMWATHLTPSLTPRGRVVSLRRAR
jgi:integrase